VNEEINERDLRFSFGSNWDKFSNKIDEERIKSSENSLKLLLKENNLRNKRFLDLGCGSGLSSLVALNLGAEVVAFDFDEKSVETTKKIIAKYQPSKVDTTPVYQGSVLDEQYMNSLGIFDIVYAWGVLHHTGDMWQAIRIASEAVAPGGRFALAIYNDQGGSSVRWRAIKKAYIKGSRLRKSFLVGLIGFFFEVRAFLVRVIKFQNPMPISDWTERKANRGMSVFHDLIDWVGGYPFEVAKPEELLEFLVERGFVLHHLKTCGGGHGCNEYLFIRSSNLKRCQD